ncbi:DAK2 domain-containing protein [Algicella marina]|uniref:DAK2 domain-containing protein n=1 Tax=Algicella marina TaxID=2683284 RepID=UPI0024DF402B|nr:DAK2 domain-containing protein [Algicella marina]
MAAASKAAEEGSDSTAEMKSQMGRSKKLGDRSIGHIDPGAASAAFLIAAMADALRNDNGLD